MNIRFLLVVVPTLLVAQETPSLLPPVLVTAERSLSPIDARAFSIDLIGSEEFLELGYRNMPEAFENTPGVLVQKTTHGHGSPFIRGFTGRQNLLLVDGVRFNNSVWRGGPVQYWNTIDPYSLSAIELIKGQGSVPYGSDAIGGTVNAITKSSGFREMEGAFFHGNLLGRYETNGGSLIGRAETTFGEGGLFGFSLGITGKDFGDIRSNDLGEMTGTGFPEQDFDLKGEFALGDETTFTFYHSQVNQDAISRWHSTLNNPGWEHDGHVVSPGSYLRRDYDQERSLSYAKLDGTLASLGDTLYALTVSYQRLSDSEYQLRSLTDERYQAAEVDTYGISLQMETEAGPGRFFYGMDWYADEVQAKGVRNGAFRPDFRPVADDSEYESLGVFAQYRWEPTDRFHLTGGVRYSHIDAHLGRLWDDTLGRDVSADRDWDNVVSSLRGSYEVTDAWSIFGGISQGFRAPNLDDLSGNVTARSGITAMGNTDLDPEKFLTYELGTKYESDNLRLAGSFFYTDIQDVITGVPVSATSTDTIAVNGQDGNVYGIELEGEWRFHPQWTLSGFVAWQDGGTDTAAYLGGPTVHQPVSRLLPLTGSLALRWTEISEKFWVEGRVTAANQADRLTITDRADTQRIPTNGTPGYIIAGLHAGWQATENLQFTLNLENISDEDYRVHGSGQNEAGFNAIIGAKISW